jgi:hypothetical protein
MDETYQRAQIVSGTKTFCVSSKIYNPIGHYRSVPAEIGSPCPSPLIQPPRSRQHPVLMTSTVEVGVVPKEAANDSNLVTEYPRESSVDQAAE